MPADPFAGSLLLAYRWLGAHARGYVRAIQAKGERGGEKEARYQAKKAVPAP